MLQAIRHKLYGLSILLKFDNKFQLILTRLFFPKMRLLVHQLEDLEFIVDYQAQEQSGTCFCLVGGAYDDLLKVMTLPSRPLNVIDAGANGGGFALMLTHKKLSIGKYLAVELNPQTYSRLFLNITRNLKADHQLINGAVAGNCGTLKVPLGIGSVADSLYSSEREEGAEEITAKLYDFDTFYNCHYTDEIIDICKIDIEGAEFDMLFQGKDDHLKSCRYVIMEIHEHPEHTEEDVFSHFQGLGFELSEARSSCEDNVFLFVNKHIEKESLS